MSTVPGERKDAASGAGELRSGPLAPAEAWAQLAPRCRPLPTEPVALAVAAGRTLGAPAVAPGPLPRETNSAMDGFAVRAVEGPHAAAPVAGEARAGSPFTGVVAPGAVVRIATGAPLPVGLDAVVPVEQSEPAGDGRISLPATEPGRHVRHAGEDLAAGAPVLAAGTRLAPHHLAGLSGAGIAAVNCHRRPRVRLIVTGDELIPAGEPARAGQVPDVHGVALPPLFAAAGAEAVAVERAGDAPGELQTLLAGRQDADLVVITGGMSAGRHDHTRAAVAASGGRLLVERLRMRPGQPTAIWDSPGGGPLWFGLPGNPVAAFVVSTLLLAPVLRALAGAAPVFPAATTTLLAAPVRPDATRWLALRATREGDAARAIERQGSHMVAGLATAELLVLVPPGDTDLPAGAPLATVPLDPREMS